MEITNTKYVQLFWQATQIVIRHELVAAAYQLQRDLTRVQRIAPLSLPTSCLRIIVYLKHMLCHAMSCNVYAYVSV